MANSLASLQIVKQEVSITLSQIENLMEVFTDNISDHSKLDAIIELISQLRGIFFVVGVEEVIYLFIQMESLAKDLRVTVVEQQPYEQLFSALDHSLIIMTRYLELLAVKNRCYPSILVSAINVIRKVKSETPLPESYFFQVDLGIERPTVEIRIDIEQLPKHCGNLRHMYQVGLLGALKEENKSPHYQLMFRALSRIDNLTASAPWARLWWVALGVMEGFVANVLELTFTRKVFLGNLDRQVKRLLYAGGELLKQEPPKELMLEGLHLVALAWAGLQLETENTEQIKYISELVEHYRLDDKTYATDLQLQHVSHWVQQPVSGVMASVHQFIQEEMAEIKNALDQSMREVDENNEQLQQITTALNKIVNTLKMLGFNKQSEILQKQIEKLEQYGEQLPDMVERGNYNDIAEMILTVENQVASMVQSSCEAREDEEVEDLELSIEKKQAVEARLALISEARDSLSFIKKAISSYIDSYWDRLHLQDVPSTLLNVFGGLNFLKLERVAQVLQSCGEYIEQSLMNSEDYYPTEHDLETLADAITVVDFYLESLEEKKPINDSILDVAEESVAELGHPIVEGG